MKLLPKVINPPSSHGSGSHQPKSYRNYRQYRDCLRWEFGFICAFCLLHESDFAIAKVTTRTGLMTIEHLSPKSERKDLENTYENLAYACRLCNSARNNKSPEGLLNPRIHSWKDNFYVNGDKLSPKNGNKEAKTTEEVYQINSKMHVTLKQIRHDKMKEYLKLISDISSYSKTLKEAIDIALVSGGQGRRQIRKLAQLKSFLKKQLDLALSDLKKFTPYPIDRPMKCKCSEEPNLPKWVANQLVSPA